MENAFVSVRDAAPKLAKTSDYNLVESTALHCCQIGDKEWTSYCLQKLSKKFPSSNRVSRDMALIKEASGDSEGAMEIYTRLLKESPEDLWLRKRLGRMLGAEKVENGVKFLEEQYMTFSADHELIHELGISHINTLNFQRALFFWEELVLNMSSVGVFYVLIVYGELLESVGDIEAARKAFSLALRHKTEEPRALWLVLNSITKSKEFFSKRDKSVAAEILKELGIECKNKLSEIYSHSDTMTSKAALRVLENLQL